MPLAVELPAPYQDTATLPVLLHGRRTSAADSRSAERAHERLGGAYRAGPLLRLLGERGERVLVVGQLRVAVANDGTCTVEAAVQSTWVESDDWAERDVPEGGLSDAELQALAETLMTTPHGLASRAPDTVAAVVMKAAVSATRSAVALLRDVRYGLERDMATTLRRPGKGSSVPVLAALLELGVAANRARDAARVSTREGLWLWLTDDDAYHRHRKALDPTLVTDLQPADAATRQWMRTHDATIRQCQQVETQLAEESVQLRGLLDAAATVASAREAEAQEAFTLLSGVAALGLGLPALVLTLYGADRLLPLNSPSRAVTLVPVALATALAAAVAVHRLPFGTRRRRVVVGVAVVLLLVGLLGVAGYLAPEALAPPLPDPAPS